MLSQIRPRPDRVGSADFFTTAAFFEAVFFTPPFLWREPSCGCLCFCLGRGASPEVAFAVPGVCGTRHIGKGVCHGLADGLGNGGRTALVRSASRRVFISLRMAAMISAFIAATSTDGAVTGLHHGGGNFLHRHFDIGGNRRRQVSCRCGDDDQAIRLQVTGLGVGGDRLLLCGDFPAPASSSTWRTSS